MHELGHGLGIGQFWQTGFQPYGAVPPINYFLSNSYANAVNEYSNITGNMFSKVPLEDNGSTSTQSAHWEMEFRPATALGADGVSYPGLTDELMIGYYEKGMKLKLSKLSIGVLKDFGYEEIHPGSSEGDPILDEGSSSITSMQMRTKDECHKFCCHRSVEIADKHCVGTIRLE